MSEPRTQPIDRIHFSRRSIMAGAGLLALLGSAPVLAHEKGRMGITALAERFPSLHPQFETALEVVAEVGDGIEVGQGPHGVRRIVPITGGEFRGLQGLRGIVLPGGADRQLIRADGVRELDAIYELQAEDGTVLMVRNRVLVDDRQPPAGWPRYARSVVRITAPDGPHAWLNRRILIGTLDSLRPAIPAVFLRFFILT